MPKQYSLYSTHLSECWKERIAKELKYNAQVPFAAWEKEADISSELSAVSRVSGTTTCSSHMPKSAMSTSTLASSVAVTKASCPDYALVVGSLRLLRILPPSAVSLPYLLRRSAPSLR